jgi:hypothetical protein
MKTTNPSDGGGFYKFLTAVAGGGIAVFAGFVLLETVQKYVLL